MRLPIIIVAAAVAALAPGAAGAASVQIKDAVVRVTVIPEARSDVKVEVVRSDPRLPILVRTSGDKTIVDGKLTWGVEACGERDGKPLVTVKKVGEVAWDEMPQLVIRTPRDVDLAAGGAVFGIVGRSDKLDLVNAGCGDWLVANVAGRLDYSQAGSGDTRIGSAGEAAIRSAGAGDVHLVSARDGLRINIAGSGDVTVGRASGPLEVKVAGSGDVSIRTGAADAMSVFVAGSGDVDFGGEAKSLKARVAGSGDVRARAVSGPVEKHVAGSGAVRVGDL